MGEDQTGNMGSPLAYSMLTGELENSRKTQESSAREMSNSVQNTMSAITVDFKNALRNFQDSLVRALDTLSLTMGRIDQNMVNIGTKIGTIGVSPVAHMSPSEYYEQRLNTRIPTGPLGVWAGTLTPGMSKLYQDYNARLSSVLYRPFNVDPITYGIEAPNLYASNMSNNLISGTAGAVEAVGGYYLTSAAVGKAAGALGAIGIGGGIAGMMLWGGIGTAVGLAIEKTLQPFVTAAIRHNDESDNLRRLSMNAGMPLSMEQARALDTNLVELGYRSSQKADLYDIKIGAQGYREIMKTALANQMVNAEDMKDLPAYAAKVGETAKLLAGFLGSKDVKEAVEQLNNLRLAGIDVIHNPQYGYDMMSSLRVASMEVGMSAQDMLNTALSSAAAAYGSVGLPASVGINGFMQNVTATRELERRGLLTREDIATGGGIKNMAQTQQQVQAQITESPEYKLMLASMIDMRTGKVSPQVIEGMKGQSLFGAMGQGLGNSLQYGPAGYMAIEANMQNLLSQMKNGKMEESTRIAMDKMLDFASDNLVPNDAPLWVKQGFEQKLLMDRFNIDRGTAASIIKQRYNPDLVGIKDDQKDYYNMQALYNEQYNRQSFGNGMDYLGDAWNKFKDRVYMNVVWRRSASGADALDRRVRDFFLPNKINMNQEENPVWTENSQNIIAYAATHKNNNVNSSYDKYVRTPTEESDKLFRLAGEDMGRIYEASSNISNLINPGLKDAIAVRATNSPVLLGRFGATLKNADGSDFTKFDFARKYGNRFYDPRKGIDELIEDARDASTPNGGGFFGVGNAGSINGMQNPFLMAQEAAAHLYFNNSDKDLLDKDREDFTQYSNSIYNNVNADDFFQQASLTDTQKKSLHDVVTNADTLDQAYMNLTERFGDSTRKAVITYMQNNPGIGNANNTADVNRVIATLAYKIRGKQDGNIETGKGFGKEGAVTAGVMYNPQLMMDTTSRIMTEDEKAKVERAISGSGKLLNIAPRELNKMLVNSFGIDSEIIDNLAGSEDLIGLQAIADAQARMAVNSKDGSGLDNEGYGIGYKTRKDFIASDAYTMSSYYKRAQNLPEEQRKKIEDEAYNVYKKSAERYINGSGINKKSREDLLKFFFTNGTEKDKQRYKQLQEEIDNSGKHFWNKTYSDPKIKEKRAEMEKILSESNMSALTTVAADNAKSSYLNILKNNGFVFTEEESKNFLDKGDITSLLRASGTTERAKTISSTLRKLDVAQSTDNSNVEKAFSDLGQVGSDIKKRMEREGKTAQSVTDIIKYYQNAVISGINTQQAKTEQASLNPKTPIDTTVTRASHGDPAVRVVVDEDPMNKLRLGATNNTTTVNNVTINTNGKNTKDINAGVYSKLNIPYQLKI